MSRFIEMSLDRGVETLQKPNLPVRISDALMPDAKAWYDKLPSKHQDEYEVALHGIERMDALRNKLGNAPSSPDAPIQLRNTTIPSGTETNLNHVYETARMAQDVSEAYPALTPHINFSDVQKIVIVHDAGEIGSGDQPPTNLSQEQQRRKDFEPKFARRLIGKIPDHAAQNEALTFYDRYIEKNPKDLEVQMAQWLDKVQGTLSIAKASQEFLKDPHKREVVHQHLLSTLPKLIPPFQNLLTYIPTQEGREAVADMMTNVLMQIETYGHRESVTQFQDQQAA